MFVKGTYIYALFPRKDWIHRSFQISKQKKKKKEHYLENKQPKQVKMKQNTNTKDIEITVPK